MLLHGHLFSCVNRVADSGNVDGSGDGGIVGGSITGGCNGSVDNAVAVDGNEDDGWDGNSNGVDCPDCASCMIFNLCFFLFSARRRRRLSRVLRLRLPL